MASPQESAGSRYEALRDRPVLPADIIAQICEQIFATPLHQYDLSLTRGRKGQWSTEISFRLSLPLVSKAWWKPATHGLYKHIVLRRLQQIPGLARTLSSKEAGIDFGALVRKITLFRCIAVMPDWNVNSQSLQAVFDRCVALEELAFHRDPDCRDTFTKSDDEYWAVLGLAHNPLWIFRKIILPALQARAPTALRKLDLASLDCNCTRKLHTALYNLMLASPHLTSLALQEYHAPTTKLPSLPLLEVLYLNFPDQAPTPSSRAIWMWDLPRLRSLTISTTELPTMVLERLGRSVTYLHLSSDTPCTRASLALLARLCPALEHLVFNPQAHTAEGICAVFDPMEPLYNLRHLDVWIKGVVDTQAWTPAEAASLLDHLRVRAAPALVTARGLLAVTPLPRDLPTICHPAMLAHAVGVEADATRFVCVRDVWMAQTAWCVQPLGDWWLDEGMWLGPDPDSEGDMSNRGEESESVGWTSDSESDDDWQRPTSRRIHRRI